MGRQIMSVMIEPIKLEFNASDTAMGLVSGLVSAVVYAFVGLPAGRLSDRYTRAKVLFISLTLWAFATLLCGFAVSFWMLIIARMLVAAAEAPVSGIAIIDRRPVPASPTLFGDQLLHWCTDHFNYCRPERRRLGSRCLWLAHGLFCNWHPADSDVAYFRTVS